MVNNLLQCVDAFHLSNDSDAWIWRWDKSGVFIVRSFFKAITDHLPHQGQVSVSFPKSLVWSPKIPLK
ncbi:hypothetical protein FRX31_024045, partial [Thalictrum thalictroides]